MLWICIILGLIVLVVGSACIRLSFFLPVQCKTNGGILLTFDDGPDPVHTPEALAALRECGAKAVFFCVGKNVVKYPEIVKQIVAEGHEIGVHGFFHNPYLNFLPYHFIFTDVLLVCIELRHLGIEPKYFRPPLGITNAKWARVKKDMGLSAMGWSVRSFDTKNEDRDKVLQRVRRQLKPNSIVLLHDRLEGVDYLIRGILKKDN